MRTVVLLLLLLAPAWAAPSPFLKAIRANDVKKVTAMLDKKPSLVDSRDPEYHSTPLMTAVATHHPEIAQLLLSKGADVNATNDYKLTALHLAVQFGFLDMARWLLDNRADPNMRSKFGVTPLGLAMANRRETIADLLREHGGRE